MRKLGLVLGCFVRLMRICPDRAATLLGGFVIATTWTGNHFFATSAWPAMFTVLASAAAGYLADGNLIQPTTDSFERSRQRFADRFRLLCYGTGITFGLFLVSLLIAHPRLEFTEFAMFAGLLVAVPLVGCYGLARFVHFKFLST